MSRTKKIKRKNRWATVKGKVISVRLNDLEFRILERRAKGRDMSVGGYLKWLAQRTRDDRGELKLEELEDDWW